jgi:hypothetical protein
LPLREQLDLSEIDLGLPLFDLEDADGFVIRWMI